ncbi:MAG: ATP-binding cassette domain-containing protein [Myxococcales bacterium]|nr:ATP-binding cassette domain-containing protein [Myxococcales bacterium]MCB9713541.1 ATP-binding cassette domain-containing protein [Myxococcales bacterium]
MNASIPWPRRRARLRFVPQMTASECSVACLAMVLAFHGMPVDRRTLRRTLGTGRDGASAHALYQAARALGLRGRALRLGAAALDSLEPGTILHWEARHFVVLERVTRGHAWILDPAVGRRRLTRVELAASFSGIALELRPDDASARRPATPGAIASPTRRRIVQATLRPGLLVPLLAVALAAVAVGLSVARLSSALVTRALSPAPRFHDLGLALAAVVIATMGVQRLRASVLRRLGLAIEAAVSDALRQRLLEVPAAFHRLRATEDLLDRLDRVRRLRTQITRLVGITVIDGPSFAIYLLVVAAWSLPMAVTAVVLASLHRAITMPLRGAQLRAASHEGREQSRLEGFQARLLRGLGAIKGAGQEAGLAARWTALRAEVDASAHAHARLELAATSVLEGFGLLVPVALLAAGAYEVSRGTLSVAAMLGLHWLAVALLRPLSSLMDLRGLRESIRGSVERIDDVLGEPAAPRPTPGPRPALPGPIELRSLTVASSTPERPALAGADARLEPAQHIAIVGGSGAGKSTLAAALVGLVRPDRGQLCIDGQDLAARGIGPGPEHGLALVSPAVPLFNGTIRDNLALGTVAASPDALEEAARLAGLHAIVEALPRGYDTAVFDDGRGLDDGLKRRIGIARALLARPGLLVLDDVAASLGAAAERELVQALLAGPVGTVVTVTPHRSTIERADLVIVLDAGRVIDSGPPAVVRDRCAGYRRLLELPAAAGSREEPTP